MGTTTTITTVPTYLTLPLHNLPPGLLLLHALVCMRFQTCATYPLMTVLDFISTCKHIACSGH
jgi:hypothetical protein